MKNISILLPTAIVLIPMMETNPVGAMLFIALVGFACLSTKP